MRVVSLLENTTDDDSMEIEHGLSLYIEAEVKKILFDMGQSDLFAKNAAKLGVDLTKVDFAVLSHGHYDHGGGMETFFKINHQANVYISKYAFEPHFNGKNRYIGLDLGILNNYKDRLIFTEDENRIDDKISIFNCNNNTFVYKLNPYGLQRGIPKIEVLPDFKHGDVVEPYNAGLQLVPEDFHHEQYLMIEGEKNVLFSGCSHKGILNIMSWCSPDILIGGFHFKSLSLEGDELSESQKVLDYAAEVLNRYNCKYYTCHCTGVPQYEYLKTLMGNKLDYLSTGKILNIK